MFSKEFPRFTAPKPRIVTSGLIAGTRVEGANGWVPVEDLRIGDGVQSYDGGMVRILGLDRQWLMPDRGAYVLHVPGGALDNCSDLDLLPGQYLMVDTLGDENLPDAIVALIPAAALEGHLGTKRRALVAQLEVITLLFADDEAIYANSGTLLHCPGITQVATETKSGFFTQLDAGQAAAFLQRAYGVPAVNPLRAAA